ncbi:cytochrome P450 [Rhizoctonia solani]|nr:cytochrome P450 [Rhizoctonia solani]
MGSGSVAFQEKIVAEYGPTLKLNGGFGEESISTADPSAVYSVLVKERPKYERSLGALLSVGSILGGGLLAKGGQPVLNHQPIQTKCTREHEGDEHRTHRKMPIFAGIAKQTCKAIKDELNASKNSPKEVDVFTWTTTAALELVGEAGLGYSFSSFTGEQNEYNIAIKSVLQVFTKIVPFMTLIPFVYRIGIYKRCDMLRKKSRQALISSDDDLSPQAGRGRDIVTLLMKANEAEGSEFYVDHQEMVGHMNTFIFAGHETTSSAVARILDVLADQPHIQTHLGEETQNYFENNPNGTNYDGLLELPYLDGAVRETLRLYTPVSFINRTVYLYLEQSRPFPVETSSGKLTSIPIKKGTRVFMSISVANRDERIWGEHAREFLPGRWIGTKIDEVTRPGAQPPGVYSSMMTFGAGPRACISLSWKLVECMHVRWNVRIANPSSTGMITEFVKDFKFEPSKKSTAGKSSICKYHTYGRILGVLQGCPSYL